MEKKTVLARLRCVVELTDETRNWLSTLRQGPFPINDENSFLMTNSVTWIEAFNDVVRSEIRAYFQRRGLRNHHAPFIELDEPYCGSWVLEAAVVMAGTAGTAYTVLKEIAELADLANGLVEAKRLIKAKLMLRMNKGASDKLFARVQLPPHAGGQAIPTQLINVNFEIDARPLLALASEKLEGHSIQLEVSVSRRTFAVRNVGELPLDDLRIGIFKSDQELNKWSYADSFMGNLTRILPGQEVLKQMTEFQDRSGNKLAFPSPKAVFVDCWVQDNLGIYIFRFHLREEPLAC